MDVLQERANELMVPLEVTAPLDYKKLNGLKLSLSGDHQFINAGLAVSLCRSWLQITGNWGKLCQNDSGEDSLPEAFLRGLSTARLFGRAQIVHDTSLKSCNSAKVAKIDSGDLIFYLDGAHSPESMEACARWFSNAMKENENMLQEPSYSSDENLQKVLGNGFVQPRESKQILLFNCMDVRDPHILLSRLVNTCASSGSHFSKAIFVPGISKYNKVTSGASLVPSNIPVRDLSWQFNLQRIWEKIVNGKDVMLDKRSMMKVAENLPPLEFLYEEVSRCSPTDGYIGCSAVIPSLPLSINWLRDCVRKNPSLKLQVLVTGSLHLVGDVLKLLRK